MKRTGYRIAGALSLALPAAAAAQTAETTTISPAILDGQIVRRLDAQPVDTRNLPVVSESDAVVFQEFLEGSGPKARRLTVRPGAVAGTWFGEAPQWAEEKPTFVEASGMPALQIAPQINVRGVFDGAAPR